jgi:putative ABC transport system permease protein
MLVVRRLGLTALAGLVIGGGASLLAGRLIESLLFGVTTRDPAAFAIAVAALLLTCAAASWLPTRRAARTDPMIVLRES